MSCITVAIVPRPHRGPAAVEFPLVVLPLSTSRHFEQWCAEAREAIVKHCVLEFGTGRLEGNIEEGFTFRCDTLEEKPA